MPNPYVMYAIGRALRPHVSFLVAGLSGTKPRFRQPLAHSTDIDAAVRLPDSPTHEWRVEQSGVGDGARDWITAILRVCRQFEIDSVITANDHEQFFLTLASARFAELGVQVLGPAHETVRAMNDKWAMLQTAPKHGIATPTTRLAGEHEDLPVDAARPVVLKRRFSQGANDVLYVRDRAELDTRLAEIKDREPLDNWIVQE